MDVTMDITPADLSDKTDLLMDLESNSSYPTGLPDQEYIVDSVFIVSILIDIIAIVGNTLVIVVLLSSKVLRRRLANQYILNQSCIDLSSAIFHMGVLTYRPEPVFDANSFSDRFYCQVWLSNAFVWALVYCSTYALMSLTLERYFSVVHPVTHKAYFSRRVCHGMMAATWICGLVEGLLLSSLSTGIVPETGVCIPFQVWPSEAVQKFAAVWTVSTHYFIPMVILIYCYVRIILVITGRINKTQPAGAEVKDNANKDKSWERARFNVIHTLIIVSVLFAICWSPNQIYYFMMNLGFPADFTSGFYYFTILSIQANSCVNPFVYMIKYDQFKAAAAHMFGCKKGDTDGELSNSTTTQVD